MIFKWESQEDRLARFMKIPAKKKLEWLQEMHEFTLKFFSKQKKKDFWKLRGIQR
jgi:hypothetical protein